MINPALPELIEPYRLADREIALEGTYEGAKLARVSEAVLEAGKLQVSAGFRRDEEGFRVVEGAVSVALSVTCERCMNPMPYDLETEFLLVMVAEEAQLSSVPKRYEPWLVAPGGDVPIAELLEDTVLLALPQFPMHPPGECRIKTSFGAEEDATDASPDTDKPNPFSVLAELKPGRKK